MSFSSPLFEHSGAPVPLLGARPGPAVRRARRPLALGPVPHPTLGDGALGGGVVGAVAAGQLPDPGRRADATDASQTVREVVAAGLDPGRN